MNNADLNRQYDKLVDHLKTERDELLWYHNFFLGSNTIILGILLTQSVGSKFLSIFLFSLALAISTIWLFTIKKQMSWIDDWLKKIKIVEKKLEISYDICLYSHTLLLQSSPDREPVQDFQTPWRLRHQYMQQLLRKTLHP